MYHSAYFYAVGVLPHYLQQVVNQNTSYVGHFVRVPYKDYPNLFKKAMLGVDDTLEVDQMRCVIYGNVMFIAR